MKTAQHDTPTYSKFLKNTCKQKYGDWHVCLSLHASR